MADMKFVVDFSDIQAMRRELVGVYKDAKKSAAVFETAYGKAERQLQKTAKANQQFYNDTLKIDKATKSASQSADVFTRELQKQGKATEAYNKETKRLQIQYNKTFRAADSFKRQLRELNEAHKRGAISTDRHEQQVMQLKGQYREFLRTGGTAMNQFGQLASKAQQKTKRFASVGLQQAGYQVGDFAVQVGAGQSALVAFGQQGSQLAGIFGPAGAVAGAVIAIGTAIGNVAFESIKASRGVKDLEDQFNELGSTLNKIEDIRLDGIAKEFAVQAEAAKESFQDILGILERVEMRVLREQLQGPLKAVLQEIKSFDFRSQVSGQLGAVDFESSFGLESRSQALFLAQQLKSLDGETKEQLQEQVQSISEALMLRGLLTDEVEKMLAKLASEVEVTNALKDGMSDTGDAVSEMNEELTRTEKMLAAVQQHSDPQNFMRAEQLLSGMADEAQRLADNLINATTNTGRMLVMMQRAFAVDPQGFMRSGQTIPGDVTEPAKTKRSSSGGGKTKPEETAMQKLVKQIELNERLLGLSEARQQVLKSLGDEASNYNQKQIDAVVQRIQAYDMEKQALEEARQQMQTMADTLENSMSKAFMSMVEGTVSFKDAMRDMARAVIKQLFDILVVQKLVGSFDSSTGKGSGIVGAIMGLFADGAAFNKGKVTAFADGGVVNKPTMFPMANGMGLMGEAGPEAVMPLKRGKGGKLGVSAEGGSGEAPVTVNNHFHIAANGDDSVKKIIQQEAPKISAMTEKQIINSRRRGGSLKQAFG